LRSHCHADRVEALPDDEAREPAEAMLKLLGPAFEVSFRQHQGPHPARAGARSAGRARSVRRTQSSQWVAALRLDLFAAYRIASALRHLPPMEGKRDRHGIRTGEHQGTDDGDN
jgi:hypothetical protein